MYSKTFPVVLLVSFVLFWSLAAGCGGEEGSPEQTSGDGEANRAESVGGNTAAARQQNTAGEPADQESGSETDAGQHPEVKIALGTIETIDPESRMLELAQVEGELLAFRVLPDARVALNERQEELSGLEAGQQAQIRYVVRDGQNRARTVRAFSDGG